MSYLLIVDDDEDFASAAASFLEKCGYEVAVSLDIKSAAASMNERCPDLVILDVMFPESDSAGFKFARTMRNDDKTKNVPILMLTGVNEKFPLGFSTSDIDDIWLPIEDFVEKPVDFDILQKKVLELLRKAR